MSLTPTASSVAGVSPDAMATGASGADGSRRVRHLALDAVALMAFSATASTVVAAAFLLLTQLSSAGR
jgi:hypothetical protein